MAEAWEDLPEELLESIFRRLGDERYLEPLSLACKRFLSLTNRLRSSLTLTGTIAFSANLDPRLFRRFSRLNRVEVVEDLQHHLHGLLIDLSRSRLQLQSLHLFKQTHFPEAAMRALGKKMWSLKALTCSTFGFIADKDLVAIAESFPELEELDINWLDVLDPGCPGRIEISDSGIGELSSKLRSLRAIHFAGNILVTSACIMYLFTNCPMLKEISVGECGFINLCELSMAIRNSPTLALSCLDLSGLFVIDEFLFSISRANFTLEKLVLARCKSFTMWGILQLLQAHQSLRYLDLEAADFLTDESIRKLACYAHKLVYVNISACHLLTNAAFIYLLQSCPSLEDIRMNQTSLGTGLALKDLVRRPQVKTLKLAWNRNLDNEALCGIGVACPNLISIDISHCWEVTDEGMSEFGKSCWKIREIDMTGCSGIKNLGTGKEFPKLEVLGAAESGIGDGWLLKAHHSCGSLWKVDLEGCLGVTERGLKAMVRNCRWLRELDLRNCYNLKLSAEYLARLVFSDSALRRIILPSPSSATRSQRDFYFRHGCLFLSK